MLSKINMVTVLICSKLKQAENWLFLQIKSGRILDTLWAFLIKQYFIPLTLIGYEVIIANSYPMRTYGIIANYACKQRVVYLYH